jgi:hypothetical protein
MLLEIANGSKELRGKYRNYLNRFINTSQFCKSKIKSIAYFVIVNECYIDIVEKCVYKRKENKNVKK